MALSRSYNPTPSTPLGFMARVAPSWGAEARSGAEALWGRDTMAGLGHGGFAPGNRLDGEVGYGLPVRSRFVGTPRVGFSASEYGRDYRLGGRRCRPPTTAFRPSNGRGPSRGRWARSLEAMQALGRTRPLATQGRRCSAC